MVSSLGLLPYHIGFDAQLSGLELANKHKKERRAKMVNQYGTVLNV